MLLHHKMMICVGQILLYFGYSTQTRRLQAIVTGSGSGVYPSVDEMKRYLHEVQLPGTASLQASGGIALLPS
jgi:hypothetical protein